MNFVLFFQCVRGRGIHILPYMDKIKVILSKSLRMKSKEGQASASIILRNLLRSLTAILSEDYRSCPEGYDRPISECLPIRLWGKPGNIHNLQVRVASSTFFQTLDIQQTSVGTCFSYSNYERRWKHSIWKSHKLSHFNLPRHKWIWILAFSTNLCPIETDMSGNTVWPQSSSFQKLAKIVHFWHF